VSRIWDAIKEAEQLRNRGGGASPGSRRPEPPEPPQNSRDKAFEEVLARSSRKSPIDRRQGKRQIHRVPLLVYGSDVDRQPFHEEGYTLEVSDSGCLVSLENEVVRGQRLFLSNMQNQAERECRVVHVGRRIRGKTRVAVEFLRSAPDFWDAA
jgi:hypothetical protein